MVDVGENAGCLMMFFSSVVWGRTGGCKLSKERRRLGFDLMKGKQVGGGGIVQKSRCEIPLIPQTIVQHEAFLAVHVLSFLFCPSIIRSGNPLAQEKRDD